MDSVFGSEDIKLEHLAEAIQYSSLNNISGNWYLLFIGLCLRSRIGYIISFIILVLTKFMKYLITLSFLSVIALNSNGQIKQEFEKELKLQVEKNQFRQEMALLNSIVGEHKDPKIIDSIKSKGTMQYVEIKPENNKKYSWKSDTVELELRAILYEEFLDLEDKGKINALKALKTEGRLKVASRGIANTIQLPRKTNARQSYNDFYLEVIRKLLINNESVVKRDHLTFLVYQSWEKQASLKTNQDITNYRVAFIFFLYKNYGL